MIRAGIEKSVCSECFSTQPILKDNIKGKNETLRQHLVGMFRIDFVMVSGDTEGVLVEQQHFV